MTGLSIGQEDRVTHSKGGYLLAAHGVNLQSGKEVVTHRELHLVTSTDGREVQHVTDGVRGCPHTESVGNIRFTTRTVGNADGHVITASFREVIIDGVTTQGVKRLPAHIPMESTGGIFLVIAVVIVRELTMGHQTNRVVRTDVQIEIPVFLQMRDFTGGDVIKHHIDTLARTHTVGG